jgi:hypothetical protein
MGIVCDKHSSKIPPILSGFFFAYSCKRGNREDGRIHHPVETMVDFGCSGFSSKESTCFKEG